MKHIFGCFNPAGALLLLAASCSLGACSDNNAQAAPGPVSTLAPNTTAILVHGAWEDGSVWNAVVPLLQQRGLKVVSVQLPRASLADDAATVKRAIDAQQGPVILVGHSYGGAVVTEAGTNAKVVALVYAAAFAPDAGQSINDILSPFPKPAWQGGIIVDEGGYLSLPADTVLNVFAPDVPSDQAKLLAVSQGPLFNHCLDDKVSTAAWKTKPSWWLVSGQDQVIPPALQQGMAQHIGAIVATSASSSHVVMISHPDDVSATVLAAATKTASQ